MLTVKQRVKQSAMTDVDLTGRDKGESDFVEMVGIIESTAVWSTSPSVQDTN